MYSYYGIWNIFGVPMHFDALAIEIIDFSVVFKHVMNAEKISWMNLHMFKNAYYSLCVSTIMVILLHRKMQNVCISMCFTSMLQSTHQGLTTYPPRVPIMAFQKSLLLLKYFNTLDVAKPERCLGLFKTKTGFHSMFKIHQDI